MTDAQHTSKSVTQTKNKRVLLVFILPLVSCLLSSMAGIVLGQIGNLFYKVIGQVAGCLAVPGFIGLFLVTFGLSFLSNRLLRKLLNRAGK